MSYQEEYARLTAELNDVCLACRLPIRAGGRIAGWCNKPLEVAGRVLRCDRQAGHHGPHQSGGTNTWVEWE